MKSRIMGELKKVFRPEFLNRIDDVIVFHKLTKDEIKRSSSCCCAAIRESMAERELQLELTEEAKDLLVEKGWDPAMGARPLRRAIQRYIEDPLADFVLRSELPRGATVMVERTPDDERARAPTTSRASLRRGQAGVHRAQAGAAAGRGGRRGRRLRGGGPGRAAGRPRAAQRGRARRRVLNSV